MFPPKTGAREMNPQFSEKCARSNRQWVNEEAESSNKQKYAPSPNQSMVIEGNNPTEAPYDRPKSILAFHSFSISEVYRAVNWERMKSIAISDMKTGLRIP